MKVDVDIAPLIQQLMADEEMPLGLLQVLLVVKKNEGLSQAQLLSEGLVNYSRQALNGYVKRLIAKNYVYVYPEIPGAKNKELRLRDEGRDYVKGLEETVARTIRLS